MDCRMLSRRRQDVLHSLVVLDKFQPRLDSTCRLVAKWSIYKRFFAAMVTSSECPARAYPHTAIKRAWFFSHNLNKLCVWVQILRCLHITHLALFLPIHPVSTCISDGWRLLAYKSHPTMLARCSGLSIEKYNSLSYYNVFNMCVQKYSSEKISIIK